MALHTSFPILGTTHCVAHTMLCTHKITLRYKLVPAGGISHVVDMRATIQFQATINSITGRSSYLDLRAARFHSHADTDWWMLSLALPTGPTERNKWLWRKFSPNFWTSSGKVAEKSKVCRWLFTGNPKNQNHEYQKYLKDNFSSVPIPLWSMLVSWECQDITTSGTISLTKPKLKNMEEGLVSPHWLVTTRIASCFPFWKTNLESIINR